MMTRYFLAAVLVTIAAAIVSVGAETATVVRVIDGDTIVAAIDGRQEKVRLIGVDTPATVDARKLVEYFGVEASAFTKSLLDGKIVELERDPNNANRDKYDRLLRYVWLDGVLVNAEIIAQGYGFAYAKYPFSRMEEFRALERQAREQEGGLWAPEAVPKSAQTAVGVASPSTTVYVTGTGEKYHREGCRYLARSSIPILLESAAGRYEPCSACRPPRM